MSAVLRHVVAARPNWIIDFQAEPGRHNVGYGIARNVFSYGSLRTPIHYDRAIEIVLFDTFANWHDRPNTRVTSCLHERFGLPWLAQYGRYELNVTEKAWYAAYDFLCSIRAPGIAQRKAKVVAIHHQGDSSKAKKDLTDNQAEQICNHILNLGRMPLLLDWRNASHLPDSIDGLQTVGPLSCADEWGRDVMMNAAIISQCEAFVGIDSGPGKCASATETPTLITWTGHSPLPFHDPAPNTTHLIPRGYKGCIPVVEDKQVIDWFEANYNVRQYDRDPVKEVKLWLSERLTN